MNLTQPALRRPFTVVVAVLAVALTALLALRLMPRDILPTLGIPTIYIAQPYGGMAPAQMEGFLTYYYEYQSLYLTGLEHVESKSIQGMALIKLQFHPGTEMAQAMAETVAAVNRARAFMPPGTVPPFVMRFDVGSVPVGNLVFSSETRGVTEIQDLALSRVRPLFSALPGVSAPPPLGSSARSVVVRLKPDRLRAVGLSADEVVAAVGAANLIIPAGNVRMGEQMPMVPVNSIVRDIQELGDVPLRLSGLPTVLLRDVATIEDGADITTGYALVNGRRTVYIPVTKRAEASTLAVVEQVRGNLPKFQSLLPGDVKVDYVFDQSPQVTRAIDSLFAEAALGAFLTGLMVLLFLRDWRTALIVLINIPLALLAAVAGLWLCGQTVNVMTLGGLALAVGILVDEATVTVENIHTHLARGRRVAGAALDATLETAVPRLLAMLCVLAVFIPSFFMAGAAKALFVPLSLAVGFSMAASYLLASTLVPVLAVWFLRGRASGGTETMKEKPGAWHSGYARLCAGLVRLRWLVLAVYLAASGLAAALVLTRLGTEIFPRVDAGQMQLRLKAPAGSHSEHTEGVALKMLALIESEAGPGNVELSLGYVGVPPPNNPINSIHLWTGGPEAALFQIQFKPGVDVERLKERLRQRLAAELPGVQISFEPADLVSRVMSLGSPTPIEVAVSGPDLASNRAFAEKVRATLARIPALRDLQFGQALDYPALEINVNRQRAGLLGVKTSDIGRAVIPVTSSSRYVTPVYWADPASGIAYQVQIQVPQESIASLEDLNNIPVTGRDPRPVLLRNLAGVKPGTVIGEFDRYNMQRTLTLTANIAGADLGGVSRQIA
jgi:multidrug efflux pump subunit AcrB